MDNSFDDGFATEPVQCGKGDAIGICKLAKLPGCFPGMPVFLPELFGALYKLRYIQKRKRSQASPKELLGVARSSSHRWLVGSLFCRYSNWAF